MRSSSFVRSLVTTAFALSIGLPTAALAAGDPAAGKAKSLACEACHVSAEPAGDTPHLAGQRASYLARQLKAFKGGDRKNPFMSAIAAQLDDADIDNLAAYWSSQPAGSDTTVSEAAAAIKKTHMAFPKDFPKGFTLYLTSNEADKNQVSKSYITAAAFQAVKAGKPLPDGTAIIVSHSSAKLDASKKPVVEKDGSWAIDKLDGYAGMEMRAGWGKDIPELLRNADWNYGVFTADKAAKPGVNQTICLACHKPQAAVSYLFSFKELQAKATGK
jgi:cytochrome c553